MSWLRKRKESEEELKQVATPSPSLGAIVSANWDTFIRCVSDSVIRLGLAEPVVSEYIDAVGKQITRVLSAFVSPANLVTPIWSANAFKRDFDRKVSIILELSISSAHELKGRVERLIESLAGGNSSGEVSKAGQELRKAILELFALYDALLVSEDVAVGLIQANLRLHHMPNVIKICLGYASQ